MIVNYDPKTFIVQATEASMTNGKNVLSIKGVNLVKMKINKLKYLILKKPP
jgi:hypothetical protein